MEITYQGTAGFERQPAAETTANKDDGTGSLVFVGPSSGLSGFLSGWPTGTQHPDDDTLRKVGHSIRHGARTVVTMRFEGIGEGGGTIDGDGTLKGEARVLRSATITKGGTEYQIIFYAPAVTVTWVSGSRPSGPLKEGTSGIASREIDIVAASKGTEKTAGDTLNDFFTEDTDYQLIAVCDGFEVDPNGDDYTIKEVWTLQADDLTAP